MNFIEFETSEKLRGGFYTEPDIAAFLTRWVLASKPTSVLEPSCGDGAFIDAILKARCPTVRSICAWEINAAEASKTRERVCNSGRVSLQVHIADFLKWYLFRSQSVRFDSVLGNPPFIRYQYLAEEQQLLAEKIFSRFGLPFTKHTNAWVPFVIASLSLLAPGGRMGMVIPSEIFHIPHAQSLRRYLVEKCSRILILDPEEIWFSDTLQGTVLLLAEKKHDASEKEKGVAVIPVTSRKLLSTDPQDLFQNIVYTNGATIEGKWMPVFLSIGERALLSQLKGEDLVKRFADLASVDVGIVTGANKFFLVPDNIVEEFALQHWAHPMFGRSEHVRGLLYSKKDHDFNKKSGLAANFLWFEEEEIKNLPSNVQRYLKAGLNQTLHTRFKCRTRTPWYRVPSVYASPIAMLKRAHHYPRLVLNKAGAYTTDTAYRIRPAGIEPESLVLAFVNSLTCLTAEIEGRHYGGGVLELVPSEIERLLVPVIQATSRELDTADQRFRSAKDSALFLRQQDARILGRIGLTKGEQGTLHNAWLKLRDRRHRVPSDEESHKAIA